MNPGLDCSPSSTMSTPQSTWRRTTPETASRTALAKIAGAVLPSAIISDSASGRGRLPTWVVRMRLCRASSMVMGFLRYRDVHDERPMVQVLKKAGDAAMTMVKASIQKTVFSAGRIEILIADQALVEHSTVWVQFSVPVPSETTRPIAEAHLNALRIVQSALASEIAGIKMVAAKP